MKHEMYAHIHEIEQSHWWYVGRRKIILDCVRTALNNRIEARVLDVGCGTGMNIVSVHRAGYHSVVGLDISVEALSFCQSRGLSKLVCGDAGTIPLRGESFDAIMALDVLEHLYDDEQALSEFVRLLSPGGALIVFAPAFRFLWGLQDEVSHHERRYTAKEVRSKVDASGLSIERLTYVNLLLFPLIWAGRLILRLSGYRTPVLSENELHPRWSNGLLEAVFSAERPLLQRFDLPFGVSLLCVAKKPAPET